MPRLFGFQIFGEQGRFDVVRDRVCSFERRVNSVELCYGYAGCTFEKRGCRLNFIPKFINLE